MKYRISILANNGDYEFIAENIDDAENKIAEALENGLLMFDDINGDTVIINRNCVLGCVIHKITEEEIKNNQL